MKVSSFLHCALRSPDPVRIGKFYADLFECGFFIHPVLAGLGVVMVKIASPESVFRGLLEFWPLDVYWDGATASLRKIPPGPIPMQAHVAFRVDRTKEEILEILTARGLQARYEPRGPGFYIVGFDDPDGNFVELFPNVETMWRGSGERTRPRVQFPASRRQTLFGVTPNTTRGDAYAPQTPRHCHHFGNLFRHLL